MDNLLIRGRLGDRLEVNKTETRDNHRIVVSFTVEVDGVYGKNNAEEVSEVMPCLTYDDFAEALVNNGYKGMSILVEGNIQSVEEVHVDNQSETTRYFLADKIYLKSREAQIVIK